MIPHPTDIFISTALVRAHGIPGSFIWNRKAGTERSKLRDWDRHVYELRFDPG